MDVLRCNLEDADHVFSKKRAALRGNSHTDFYIADNLVHISSEAAID